MCERDACMECACVFVVCLYVHIPVVDLLECTLNIPNLCTYTRSWVVPDMTGTIVASNFFFSSM